MNHYTYLIKNMKTSKKYIGVRSCHCSPEQDNYMGSSKYLNEAIRIEGIDKFKKRILMVYGTRKEAIDHEITLHSRYQVKSNPLFYNRAEQSSNGFDGYGATAWNKGKKCPQISEARLGQPAKNKGKPMSIAQKTKLSDVWEVILPDGNLIEISNMHQFCAENGLNPSAMSQVAKGRHQQHKGYKCKKVVHKRSTPYNVTEWVSKGKPGRPNFGSNNGQSTKISIGGVEYACMREASEKTGLSLYKMRKYNNE